jgi:uncharacterized phage-associated protein
MGKYKDTYEYDSVDLAFYIAAYANERRISINITKVQKLLYITYGAHLVLRENRLCNEHPQAWPYGPVFPRTRKALIKTDIYGIKMSDPRLNDLKNDPYIAKLTERVFSKFGNRTATELTEWSHRPRTPWDETKRQPYFKWGNEIPDAYIREFFSNIIRTTANNERQ